MKRILVHEENTLIKKLIWIINKSHFGKNSNAYYGDKIRNSIIHMEVVSWFCPYCLGYYLLAYIVKHKLTMKHKEDKEEFH